MKRRLGSELSAVRVTGSPDSTAHDESLPTGVHAALGPEEVAWTVVWDVDVDAVTVRSASNSTSRVMFFVIFSGTRKQPVSRAGDFASANPVLEEVTGGRVRNQYHIRAFGG